MHGIGRLPSFIPRFKIFNESRSIRRRLFSASFIYLSIVGLLVFVGAFVVLSYFNHRNAVRGVEASLDILEPSLLRAAWQISETGTQTILDTIVSNGQVAFAKYEDENFTLSAHRRILSADAHRTSDDVVDCDQPIERSLVGKEHEEETLESGLLSVCLRSNLDVSETAFSLIWSGVFLFFIILIGAFGPTIIATRLLVDPIVTLSQILKKGENLDKIIETDGCAHARDEIGTLYLEISQRTQKLEIERNLSDEIFEAVPSAIAVCDKSFTIIRTNRLFNESFSEGDGVGCDLRELVPPEIIKTRGDGTESIHYKKRFWDYSLVENHYGGRQDILIFLAHDATERRQLDTERQQHKKLAALGTLAGGIAHDFNNLLSVVLGATEVMQLGNTDQVSQQELLREIEEASLHAKALTRQLLTFSRRSDLKRERIKLSTIIDRAVAMSQRTIGSMHNLVVEAGEDGYLCTDIAALQVSLLNLVLNARDAMKDGGDINIKYFIQGGKLAVMEVQNQSEKIPEHVLNRLTEPFFTTKDVGEGTGLGLSMVDGFVRQEGGTLEIESDDIKGTVVRITLEVDKTAPPVTEKLQLSTTINPTQNPKKSVLLIEDSDVVRRTTSKMIETLGHEVTAYAGLDELEASNSVSGNNWDIILSDFALQGHTGLDILKYLRTNGVDTRFAVLSGNLDESTTNDLIHNGANDTIEKPIPLAELRKLLE